MKGVQCYELLEGIALKMHKFLFSFYVKIHYACRTVRNTTNIDHPSFIAEPSSVSEFSSVEKANQYCDYLRTVLDNSQLLSMVRVNKI